MTIDLYYNPLSPACRTVLLTAKHLGIQLNCIELDLSDKKEHLNPEFLKLNPQHTVPTIVDGELVVSESRVIIKYLVSAYSKQKSLYPEDLTIRANIDRMLFFDADKLNTRLMDYCKSVLSTEQNNEDVHHEKLKEALQWLNDDLDGRFFAVSNRITIADCALCVTISTLVYSGVDDLRNYPAIKNWFSRCELQINGYEEINSNAAKKLADIFKIKQKLDRKNWRK